jgi:hypothetical protein
LMQVVYLKLGYRTRFGYKDTLNDMYTSTITNKQIVSVPLIAIDSSLLLLTLQDLRIFQNDEIGKDEIENMFRVLYIGIILSTSLFLDN